MKRMAMNVILLAVLPILFAGCRVSMYVPMHQDVLSKIPSTDVIIGLNQETIYVEIRSQAAGGGLIASMIDVAIESSPTKRAETLITPVRNAMNGYTFGADLKRSVEEGLGKIDWMHVRSVKQVQPFNAELNEKIIQGSSSSAVLIMKPRYFLTPDLDVFMIRMEVSVYPVSPELKALVDQLKPDVIAPLLYRNDLTFFFPLRGEFNDRETAAQAWCVDSGKLIRTAMTDGIAEISRMLVLGLETARTQARDKNQKTETGKEVRYERIYGTVIADTSDRVVLREPTGELYSVPKDLIE